MANSVFSLGVGDTEWINARLDERKRVSAGSGDLMIDRKPFENGTSVVIDSPVIIYGPGRLVVQDTEAEVLNKSTAKPKKKAKKTEES